MSGEILAVALIKAHEGKEEECVQLLRELYAMLMNQGYSRDHLYQHVQNRRQFVHVRYWKSQEARATAHEDPRVHQFWRRLGEVCEIEQVYEELEQVI